MEGLIYVCGVRNRREHGNISSKRPMKARYAVPVSKEQAGNTGTSGTKKPRPSTAGAQVVSEGGRATRRSRRRRGWSRGWSRSRSQRDRRRSGGRAGERSWVPLWWLPVAGRGQGSPSGYRWGQGCPVGRLKGVPARVARWGPSCPQDRGVPSLAARPGPPPQGRGNQWRVASTSGPLS